MLIICIKCFYFQLARKADFVLWQCFLCDMVPILLGTGHYLCRGRGGGRGGKQDGEESRLFQITKSGGLNSFIKKFRGGSAVWSQVTFSKFPNIHSSLCSSHIFDLCHWTVHHNFLQLMTILWLFAHSSVWSSISEGLERKVRYLPKRALLSSDNMYFSFLSTLSVLFFIPHLLPRSKIK